MRKCVRFVIVVLVAIWTTAVIEAQQPITSNPIPAPIMKCGLEVEIKDRLRLPDTRGMRPVEQDGSPSGWARISFVRDLPDGRRFVNDSRGILYLVGSNDQLSTYVNVAEAFPNAVYNH
jgi:hypothetical protein